MDRMGSVLAGASKSFVAVPLYLIWVIYLGRWFFLGLPSVLLLLGMAVTVTGGILAMSKPKVGKLVRPLLSR